MTHDTEGQETQYTLVIGNCEAMEAENRNKKWFQRKKSRAEIN
jgi:hypothetical protein